MGQCRNRHMLFKGKINQHFAHNFSFSPFLSLSLVNFEFLLRTLILFRQRHTNCKFRMVGLILQIIWFVRWQLYKNSLQCVQHRTQTSTLLKSIQFFIYRTFFFFPLESPITICYFLFEFDVKMSHKNFCLLFC